MKTPNVSFIPVADNAAKLKTICEIVHNQFHAGKTLLIRVPNAEAAAYVDALLWKAPEESFLPHCIALQSTPERCVISYANSNVNKASVLLNLCSDICPFHVEFETIFELWDETHPSKLDLSAKRKADYATLITT